MFDRYTIIADPSSISDHFGIQPSDPFDPIYNAAPAMRLPIITNEKPHLLQFFYWGLMPKMANNKPITRKLINLPLETALNRPVYQKALKSSRCLIIADGFYSWKQISKKQMTPYYYTKEQTVFAIAGIWEDYEDLDGLQIQCFNMLTVPAAHALKNHLIDTPAIIAPELASDWLHAEDLTLANQILTGYNSET